MHNEDILEPIISCSYCGNVLGQSATKEVTRVYHGRSFVEHWCLLCANSVESATETAKSFSQDEQPEY